MIKIKKFTINLLSVNAFILYDETKEAIIIDPAISNEKEISDITEFVKKENLTIKYILNTHGHFDHISGNAYFKEKLNIPILMHNGDNIWISECDKIAIQYSIEIPEQPLPDKYIEDGEKIFFGNSYLEARYVPGHSKGSLAFYAEEIKSIFVGDTLFYENIGRVDLPDGNYNTLIKNIKEKILSLSLDTIVYPGHGESTTVAHEIKNNYYLK